MSSPPTPYVRAYDFVAFQVANPTTPLPADKLHIELAALKTTTDQLISRLAEIQRDDGALKNGIVTDESLDAGFLDQYYNDLVDDIAAALFEAAEQQGRGVIKAYDPAFYFSWRPQSNEVLVRYLVKRFSEFEPGFPGSGAVCVVAPTSTYVLEIKVNGVTIGTITFQAGQTLGVFAVALQQNLVPGDVLTIQAPAVADPTFEGLSITLIGVSLG